MIVTDGGDTISQTDFQRATEAAQLADAVIYPILVVPITNEAGRNVGGENALTTFALRTGGRVFEPSLGAALDQAFDQILRDLRTQYLLGFYPQRRTADQRTVSLAGRRPWQVRGLQVKARSGYYGERSQRIRSGSGRTGAVARTRRRRRNAGEETAAAKARRGTSGKRKGIKTNRATKQSQSRASGRTDVRGDQIPEAPDRSEDSGLREAGDNEEVRGVVEYYDQRFIRLTRAGAPNLFIFKHDIKYLYEVA